MRRFPEQRTEPTIGREHCASDVYWFNFTIIQSVSVVYLGSTGRRDRALSFKFGLDISQEKTSTTAMPVPITVSPQQIFENESIRTPTSLNPYIFNIGPYVIKNTSQQQMLLTRPTLSSEWNYQCR